MTRSKIKLQTIDEYIGTFPEGIQEILEEVRRLIRETAPDAEETINYKIPTFKLNGNLVHFAAYKTHIGFYPTPSGIEDFKEELSQYKPAKGSVKFPLNKSIPYKLIRRFVEFRVKEQLEKKK